MGHEAREVCLHKDCCTASLHSRSLDDFGSSVMCGSTTLAFPNQGKYSVLEVLSAPNIFTQGQALSDESHEDEKDFHRNAKNFEKVMCNNLIVLEETFF